MKATFDDPGAWFDEHRERVIDNYRYHCQVCGRFVPFATVSAHYNRWDGDRTDEGICKTHGRVEVFWGQS